MKHLYNTATGGLVSSATVINNVPDGMAVKESSKKGVWNPEVLDFDPLPKRTTMVTLDFMELFTDEEMVGILSAAKDNVNLQLFVMKMEQASFMDLAYQPTIDGINTLAAAGLLTPARATMILSGEKPNG